MTLLLLGVRLTAILGAGLALAWLLRRRSAALRHAVLVTTVLAAAMSPLASLVAPAWSPWTSTPDVPITPDAVVEIAVRPTTTAPEPTNTPASATPSRMTRVSDGLLFVWAIAACIGLARLGLSLWRVRGWARRAAPSDDPRFAGTPVLIGDADAPVVTWGWMRPRVLLPSTALTWSDAQIRTVLAHERAHIARGDWAWTIVLAVAEAIYAWHPLMWRLTRLARRDAERACDDEVLRTGVPASAYASVLMDVARSRRATRIVAAVAMAETGTLEQRITDMLDRTIDHSPVSRRVRTVWTAALLSLGVAIAGLGAQAREGTVTGTVSPAAGSPIAGIAVTFTGAQGATEVVTNADGQYTVALPAGAYRAEIKTMGFKPFASRVDVVAGEKTVRNFALALGTVQESIRVTGGGTAAPRTAGTRAGELPPHEGSGNTIDPPKKVFDVRPVYDAALANAGVAGQVTLNARIGVDGYVTDVQVVGEPHDGLARAAVEAVEQWRYAPTYVQGKAVPTEMTISVTFGDSGR